MLNSHQSRARVRVKSSQERKIQARERDGDRIERVVDCVLVVVIVKRGKYIGRPIFPSPRVVPHTRDCGKFSSTGKRVKPCKTGTLRLGVLRAPRPCAGYRHIDTEYKAQMASRCTADSRDMLRIGTEMGEREARWKNEGRRHAKLALRDRASK